MSGKPRKRIWVQHVAVDAEALLTRVKAARLHGLSREQAGIAEDVSEYVRRARDAALREDPIPGRWGNWWRGTLVEAAYRNLHAARAGVVDLYDEHELRAEIPGAVARAQSTMHREDPRQLRAEDLAVGVSVLDLRPRLRRLINDSYDSLDGQHAQLRSFRNILLMSAFVITILIVATVAVVSQRPTVMPLCFPNEITTAVNPDVTQEVGMNCPTRSETDEPSGGDVLIVALLGLLGGALAASVSIRNLKGTSSTYDVPVALALFKIPLGAVTAILALVAIQGEFVPGLGVLDSQEQILAYALVFGFAQQAFTRLLDQRAQTLLEGLPGKDPATEPPRAPVAAGPSPEPPHTIEGEVGEPESSLQDDTQQDVVNSPAEPTVRSQSTTRQQREQT